MSEKALRQRRRNLKRTRIRSDRETTIIKRFILQTCFDGGKRPSQRALARQLGVWPSYVWKVQQKALSEGLDALLANDGRVTLDDLEKARSFTATLRTQEPGPLPPALDERATEEHARTPDENIAATWDEVNDWKRKNLWRSDTRRRIRVPIPF
jgi:hypothetical protein